MSVPRLLRTATSTPCFASAAAKRRIPSGDVGVYEPAPPGCSGIRLTNAPQRLASRARSAACVGWSLTPPSITYSKVTRRLNDAAASMTFSSGNLMFTGMSMRRNSSEGACTEMASRNCSGRCASASMPGSTPTVETVMCRAPMPHPLGSLRIVSTTVTAFQFIMGSPMPMKTMFVGVTGSGRSASSRTCPAISDGSRFR